MPGFFEMIIIGRNVQMSISLFFWRHASQHNMPTKKHLGDTWQARKMIENTIQLWV